MKKTRANGENNSPWCVWLKQLLSQSVSEARVRVFEGMCVCVCAGTCENGKSCYNQQQLLKVTYTFQYKVWEEKDRKMVHELWIYASKTPTRWVLGLLEFHHGLYTSMEQVSTRSTLMGDGPIYFMLWMNQELPLSSKKPLFLSLCTYVGCVVSCHDNSPLLPACLPGFGFVPSDWCLAAPGSALLLSNDSLMEFYCQFFRL